MASWWKYGLGGIGLAAAGLGTAFLVQRWQRKCGMCQQFVREGKLTSALTDSRSRVCRECGELAVAQAPAVAEKIADNIAMYQAQKSQRDFWEGEMLALPGNIELLAHRAGLQPAELQGG